MADEPAPTFAEFLTQLRTLQANIASVFLGKPELVRLSLVSLLAEGHLLLEDVPGVGKTLLGKAIAKSLDCEFHRVQFTPDLLPSDLIGTSIYNQQTQSFTFQKGPLFTQVLLADEINRATPRTQSALLEAMSEKQITIDGATRKLGSPFLVLATQNPYEFEGTYPLPESQLDRFLVRLTVGYPSRESDRAILKQHRSGEPVEHLQAVLTAADVRKLQEFTRNIRVEDSLSEYILELIHATRNHPEIRLGASTRAALAFYRAAQAFAFLQERDYVIPDDIKGLAESVLSHRILTKSWDQGGQENNAALIREILAKTPVPK
jgi:MoxR-like ATPase